MLTVATIEIDRPVEEVFEFTITQVSTWSHVVESEEIIEEVPGHVGSRFRCHTRSEGRVVVLDGEVLRHEPPRVSVSRMTSPSFDILAEYDFEDLGGRTRVTQRSTVTPKGFVKLIFILFGWAMKKSSCRAAENELESLKQHLENGEGAS